MAQGGRRAGGSALRRRELPSAPPPAGPLGKMAGRLCPAVARGLVGVPAPLDVRPGRTGGPEVAPGPGRNAVAGRGATAPSGAGRKGRAGRPAAEPGAGRGGDPAEPGAGRGPAAGRGGGSGAPVPGRGPLAGRGGGRVPPSASAGGRRRAGRGGGVPVDPGVRGGRTGPPERGRPLLEPPSAGGRAAPAGRGERGAEAVAPPAERAPARRGGGDPAGRDPVVGSGSVKPDSGIALATPGAASASGRYGDGVALDLASAAGSVPAERGGIRRGRVPGFSDGDGGGVAPPGCSREGGR
jgi:hypothetical protein